MANRVIALYWDHLKEGAYDGLETSTPPSSRSLSCNRAGTCMPPRSILSQFPPSRHTNLHLHFKTSSLMVSTGLEPSERVAVIVRWLSAEVFLALLTYRFLGHRHNGLDIHPICHFAPTSYRLCHDHPAPVALHVAHPHRGCPGRARLFKDAPRVSTVEPLTL